VPRLRVLPSNDRPWEVDLVAEVVVGRAPPADVVIRDALVSRRHCRVVLLDGAWHVEDLGSANGTCINGRRVERAVLRDGDRIGVGFAALEFVAG